VGVQPVWHGRHEYQAQRSASTTLAFNTEFA
jgi:hypothetical protein